MTIPPPPTAPPTVGMPDAAPEPEPAVEWWRKSGPWNPRRPAAEPTSVDLRKTEPAEPANDFEDQAVEDGGQDHPEAEADPERYDLRTVAESLRLLISQTPEEQAERARRDREEAYRQRGETPDEREDRHRAEQLVQERRASVLWRQPQSERARRFRRWCILTTTSAVLGYQMGAVQLAAHVPLSVAALAAGGAWLIDLRMRGWGHVRVSEVRGFPGLTILILLRVPFASALVGALGLAPLITLLSSSHH
ncbi:hypothetical protein ABTZ03_04725 [Kitasatospora sp. NPDC096077]|uniref:hypothetical protein n=1 Tax=Kitasatospora sp. NPDC096077 TaxID=3155544 RepID=UPI00331F3B12